jgi:hypothetical protein
VGSKAAVVGVAPTTRHAFQFPIFHLSKPLLVTTPTTARNKSSLKERTLKYLISVFLKCAGHNTSSNNPFAYVLFFKKEQS